MGSSSLREELFNSYLKANVTAANPTDQPSKSSPADGIREEPHTDDEETRDRKRKERKERAVKEREERVHAERNKLNAEIDRSRSGLNREEAELHYRCAA